MSDPTPPSPEGSPVRPDLPDALAQIVAHKRAEVEAAKASTPLGELEAMIIQEEEPRNFFAAVRRTASGAGGEKGGVAGVGTAVIAEIKRKSPSAGWIRPEYQSEAFSPEDIARRYEAAGAAAISCLTDERFFGGKLSYIRRVKEAVGLPVLRKDFLIDPYQVWESRAAGADAVLLIAECLTHGALLDMMILAQQLRLTVLLEVHEVESLLRVRPHVGFPHASYSLLGINNRDLRAMRVDLNHTLRLVEMVEDPSVLVSESGIRTPEDLRRLRESGVRMVLVGEHLMRQPDPGAALRALLAPANPYPQA